MFGYSYLLHMNTISRSRASCWDVLEHVLRRSCDLECRLDKGSSVGMKLLLGFKDRRYLGQVSSKISIIQINTQRVRQEREALSARLAPISCLLLEF